MTCTIDFTPRARAQFLAAVDYIRAEHPSAARAFRERSNEVLKHLIRFPEAGRTIPELSQLGFREVLVGRYRFFYRLQGDVIWVVGVWHDAQIPDEPV
ncbi:MAG: type II toxin-antitoxin system RelE/ParE family toxin [Coriobacteriia bacterium]|nr:type II toxin-antitoxin system RelE/ParE family toxin [Actinomycetota bacterium]MDZ4166911.1 type II toxin-antitoxin system RelE/ParE family toxin [Coriobacteriia bacterium]